MGRAKIDKILNNPPEYVATAKVFDMLMAVPKFGRVKAARFLNQARISQSKTVGASPTASGLSSLGSSTGSEPTPVFVVTGTSGAGKGTLEKALLVQIPELELAVSATTRERGEGRRTAASTGSSRTRSSTRSSAAASSSSTSSSPGASAPGPCARRSRASSERGESRCSTSSRSGRSR